jgi:hypothetical protein
MSVEKPIMKCTLAESNLGTDCGLNDTPAWICLTDEYLEVCLKDFDLLSRCGDERYRRLNAQTRDEMIAECVRRGRFDIAERADVRHDLQQ